MVLSAQSQGLASTIRTVDHDDLFHERPTSIFSSSARARAGLPAAESFQIPESSENRVRYDDLRQAVVRHHAPHVGIAATSGVRSLIEDAGGTELCALFRRQGDYVRGKVVIRDGAGASKAFDDYRVDFVNAEKVGRPLDFELHATEGLLILDEIEKKARHIAEDGMASLLHVYTADLLDSRIVVPFETVQHPVAVVVIAAANELDLLETFARLLLQASQDVDWMSKPCLKYYVVVHDDSKDDLAKSQSAYETVRRNLGLHCHLLRVASTTEENIAIMVRELVTQSIVPSMETRMFAWNELLASRRRGFGGRIMSFSKRWTGMGSGKNSAANSRSPSASASRSSYDAEKGSYAADSAESSLRQLGDYSMILRDYRLATETFEAIRADHTEDQAWSYHAAANEMASVSGLLATLRRPLGLETVDQYLEAAFYSFKTRCNFPYEAVRCVVVSLALLQSSAYIWAPLLGRKWAQRLLEARLLGPVGQAMLTEVIVESLLQSACRRQAALWSALAAQSWTRADISHRAERCLNLAQQLYSCSLARGLHDPWHEAQDSDLVLLGGFKSHLRNQSHSTLAPESDEGFADALVTR